MVAASYEKKRGTGRMFNMQGVRYNICGLTRVVNAVVVMLEMRPWVKKADKTK